MRRTSTARAAADARSGFSLLEMLVVLAIMGLALAIVMPRGAVMMDRVLSHALFFDFQRQVSDLRRDAYRTQAAVVLSDSAAAAVDPAARVLPLRAGWTYRMERPLTIGSGGLCAGGPVEILKSGKPVMHLAAPGPDCRFVRLD